MDRFTSSYDLNDGGLDPENKDQEGFPNDHDGRWSWMPWGKWAGLKTKAIMVWRGEMVTTPLELTLAVPNGRYDVYLGLHHHTLMAAVEVRMGPASETDDFRWVRTPRADQGSISNVRAGTVEVRGGRLHLWLRNGRGYWAAIDYVRIGPVGFNPDRLGVRDPSLLEPRFSLEVQDLRRALGEGGEVSTVVMDGSESDAVTAIDVANVRTRPYVESTLSVLGGLDTGFPGDDRCVELASHVYQNCAGRQILLVGVERREGAGPLLLECGHLRDGDGSPLTQVRWDGKLIGTFDSRHDVRHATISAFVIPPEQAGIGRHELELREAELTEGAQNFAWIDAISVTGQGKLSLCPVRPATRPAQRAKLRLVDARYRPDRDPAVPLGQTRRTGPGYSELNDRKLGRHDVRTRGTRDFTATGSIHFYLANDGPAPAEDVRCRLDGTDIETLRHEFGSAYPREPRLLWWRVRPRRIDPGGLAEVTIRFTRPPTMPARFSVKAGNSDPLPLTVDADQPPFRIEYVAFPVTIDRMLIYLESDAPADGLGNWEPGRILLNGVDVTRHGKVYAAGRHHRLIVVSLDRHRLSEASHHLLHVSDKQGRGQTVQVMAWRSIFQVGAFSVTGHVVNKLPGGNVNSVHSVVGAHGDGVDAVRQFAHLGVRLTVVALGEVSDEIKRNGTGMLAYFMTDEPDAHDDPLAEGKLPWLGWGVQHYVNYGGVLKDLWPLPTTLVVNMTTRPDNLFVYGQSVDILQHDPYFPPDVVRPQIRSAAQSAAPNPAVAVLWAFSEGMDWGRPSPAVVRMNAYSALGSGAKGITHFACIFKNQGFGQVPELQEAVHAINAELLAAAPLLNLSHPIVTEIDSPDDVWARLLLCGDRGAALVMVNDKVTRQERQRVIDFPGGRTLMRKGAIIGYEELGPFEPSVVLPPWLKAKTVSLITPEGRRPVPFEQVGTRLTCRGVTVGAGAMVLIER